MKRREFLTGLLAAPLVVKTPGLLMPVKPVKPAIIEGKLYSYQVQYLKMIMNSTYGKNSLTPLHDPKIAISYYEQLRKLRS